MRTVYSIILAALFFTSYCQEVTYGELHEFSSLYFNQAPEEIVSCEDFFANYDSAMGLRPFIHDECSPNGPINRKEIHPRITKYPEEAIFYRVSGSALIEFLVDKNGKLVCYRIKTELGKAFIRQIERHLKEYEFEKFTCNGVPYAYVTVTGFIYKYKKKMKYRL